MLLTLLILTGLTILVFVLAYGTRFVLYHSLRRLDKTSATYVSSVAQIATIVGGSYAIAKYYDFDPTIIIALVAIVTAGISLHAGQLIEAGIAGAVLLLSNHMKVGEFVTVAGDVSGLVTSIGLTSVTIQSNSRGLVIIPSSKIVGDVIINHTRLPAIEMTLNFIFFDTHDNAAAIKTMNATLDSQGLKEGSKILHEWVNGSQTYAIVFKVTDYQKRREVSSRLSLALTGALEHAQFPLGSVTFVKQL